MRFVGFAEVQRHFAQLAQDIDAFRRSGAHHGQRTVVLFIGFGVTTTFGSAFAERGVPQPFEGTVIHMLCQPQRPAQHLFAFIRLPRL